MNTPTSDEVANLVFCAKKLVAAFERRSPTSKWATLGELDALFDLRYTLRQVDAEHELAPPKVEA